MATPTCVAGSSHAAILADIELDAWRALPRSERIVASLRAWVAKEAMLTSLGYGIGAGMDHFALPMPWDAEPALTMGAT